jgi:hemerythrin-like domain-containing protein
MMHPLFQQISGEHQRILSALSRLETAEKKEELVELTRWLWKWVVEDHHHKEESLLFEKIYRNPRINEGGPQCGLFFHLHMLSRAKDAVEAITGRPLRITPLQQEIVDSGAPLAVPIEEHRGGKDLLQFILDNEEQLDFDLMKKYLTIFKTHLVSHIQKEEKCLYHLCASLLTTEEADKILEQWKKETRHF